MHTPVPPINFAASNGVCDTPRLLAYAIRRHEELQGKPGAACLDYQHDEGEAAGPTKKKNQEFMMLFFPEIYRNRNAGKGVLLADFVLEKAPVRVFKVLWQIAVECEGGIGSRQLGNKFDSNVFPFYRRRRRLLNNGQHVVV
jgi:hypothetical protein